MQRVSKGDQLRRQNAEGHWQTYIVRERRIADSRRDPLLLDSTSNQLWLVTCYPFNALQANGPLRYVVRAESVPEYVMGGSQRVGASNDWRLRPDVGCGGVARCDAFR